VGAAIGVIAFSSSRGEFIAGIEAYQCEPAGKLSRFPAGWRIVERSAVPIER